MMIVFWGGVYFVLQNNVYYKLYMEKNLGVNIINDELFVEVVVKFCVMNEVGNIIWDLVDVVVFDVICLCDEGLVFEIDLDMDLVVVLDGILVFEDFGDLLVFECFILQIVYFIIFGYWFDVVEWGGKELIDVCVVFDLENFLGKWFLEKCLINNVEWVLFCDGVVKEDVYDVLEIEEGLVQVLVKFDIIKDDVVWWFVGVEMLQLFVDGEVVIGLIYNGCLFVLIEEQKQLVKMLWDVQVFDFDGWIILVGLLEECFVCVKDYVMFVIDIQCFVDQVKYIFYGLVCVLFVLLVGQYVILGIDMVLYMLIDLENVKNIFFYNYEWWVDYCDDIDVKFQVWLVQ